MTDTILLTAADLRGLSPSAINAAWERGEIQDILTGEAAAAQGPPASLDDLRGRSESYINRHWATVAQLLQEERVK